MRMRLLSIVSVALFSIFTAFAEQIQVPDVALAQGGSAIVEISLNNEHADFVAFQMDLILPEGICIDKEGCRLSSRVTDEEQKLVIGKLESGGYRLTSASMSLTPIHGTEGSLLIITLSSDKNFVQGKAVIDNILFSTSSSERVLMEDVTFTINTLYNLTYIVDGELYATSTVAYGTALTPEATPTREGYVFSGWSEIPATMPARDVVVTGSFTINSYTITYVLDGEVFLTETLEFGAKIVPPVIPYLEGYSIWEDVPETMPACDITIYGKAKDIIDNLTPVFSKGERKVYDLNGRKLSAPQKGINIIRMSDGTTRKVMIR